MPNIADTVRDLNGNDHLVSKVHDDGSIDLRSGHHIGARSSWNVITVDEVQALDNLRMILGARRMT